MGSKADGFSQQLNGVVVALGVDEVLRELRASVECPGFSLSPCSRSLMARRFCPLASQAMAVSLVKPPWRGKRLRAAVRVLSAASWRPSCPSEAA